MSGHTASDPSRSAGVRTTRNVRGTKASKIAALVTEKFQRGEDSRLTDDQHHHPFEKIDLVGFHRRQQLTFESTHVAPEQAQVALEQAQAASEKSRSL